MASEVTVRKLTSGFTVSESGGAAFAETTRPAMIQRVLRCLGIEPAEAYLDNKPTEKVRTVYAHVPPFVLADADDQPGSLKNGEAFRAPELTGREHA